MCLKGYIFRHYHFLVDVTYDGNIDIELISIVKILMQVVSVTGF